MLRKELLSTIRAVHARRKALSAKVTYEVAERVDKDPLSPMEGRVLRMIADGNSSKQIATHLNITEEASRVRAEDTCGLWPISRRQSWKAPRSACARSS